MQPNLPISRRLALGVLAAPIIAGCQASSLLEPSKPALQAMADGSYRLLVVCDSHNHPRLANGLFALGDLAGAFGTAKEFAYFRETWGSFLDRLWAGLGNHDRRADPTATAYYDTFNEDGRAGRRGHGYYGLTFGNWRVYVLNSEHDTDVQAAWLAQDLPQYAGHHIAAFWHKPRFVSTGPNVPVGSFWVRRFWKVLQLHQAELVVCGHIHWYERYARARESGVRDPSGIRQFVVGTGGGTKMTRETAHPASEAYFRGFGVLQLDLQPDRYGWKFLSVSGEILDGGEELCRKS